MVTLLVPVVIEAPTYAKVVNVNGLYRHARSGRYYGCKKLGGIRRERSLGTCDRKIAERRLKEWVGNLDKADTEVEKITLSKLIERFRKVTCSVAENTRVTDNAIIKRFLAWWPHGKDYQVRQIRPSIREQAGQGQAGNGKQTEGGSFHLPQNGFVYAFDPSSPRGAQGRYFQHDG